jgi:vacuolar protein 8
VAQLWQDGDLHGLVRVLGDTSTEYDTKMDAAGALGNLMGADDDDDYLDIVAVVVAAGAIPLLVELLRGGSNQLSRSEIAATLETLAFDNDNLAAVVAAGALPQLVELLRGSWGEGRAKAARTLTIFVGGCNNDIAAAVVAAGALLPLVELLSVGSDMGRANAAVALTMLSSRTIKAAVVATGAILPL